VLHPVLVSVALPRAGVSRPFLVVDQRRTAVPVKRRGRVPRERLTGAVAGATATAMSGRRKSFAIFPWLQTASGQRIPRTRQDHQSPGTQPRAAIPS
jgi:hypothetical protein